MALGADVSVHIVPTCNADCLTGRQGGWRLVGGTYLTVSGEEAKCAKINGATRNRTAALDVAVEGT